MYSSLHFYNTQTLNYEKILLLIATVILFNCTNDDSDSIDTNNSIEMVSEFNKWYHRGEYEYFNGATATIESTKIYLTYFLMEIRLLTMLSTKKCIQIS